MIKNYKDRGDYKVRENKTKKEELEAFKEVMQQLQKTFEGDEPMIIIANNLILARGSVLDMGGMIGSFIDKIVREDPHSKAAFKHMYTLLDHIHNISEVEDPFSDPFGEEEVPSIEELKERLEALKKAFGVEAEIDEEK